jgi:hypothetical protein
MFSGGHWRPVVIKGTMETPPICKPIPEIEALVPEALSWSTDQCVAWLYVMGLPQYEVSPWGWGEGASCGVRPGG